MSTCLTTKLDGVVTDKDFRAPSEFRIKVKKQDNYIQVRAWFAINSRVNQVVKLINEDNTEENNYFFDINGNNLGKSVEFSAGANRIVYCTNGTYEISIPNKYAIATFDTGRYAPQTDFFTFDIEELKYITTIQTINSSGTTAKGDIKALAQCTTLQNITLERTSVKGDIEDLSPLTNLQYIRFTTCNDITGDLSLFEHTPDIRNIEVGGCIGIHGNLSSLANCSMLSYITMPGNGGMVNITGDINAFANKDYITRIQIENEPEVVGDIAVFNTNTKNLWGLYLSVTSISGDIADLAPCKRLAALRLLNDFNINGDLSVFLEDKPFLDTIDIRNTGISGDITDANVPLLVTAYLENTGVSGSIGKVDFAGLVDGNNNELLPPHSEEDGFVKHSPNIVSFTAGNTLLEGDINVFANCSKLNYLNLINTNVQGDVASLAGIASLNDIRLGYTKVHGDIGTGLSNCTNLTQLYVENCPYISGDLSKLGNNLKFVSASLTSGTFTWATTRPSTAYIIAMSNVHLGEYLDIMLINQANCVPNSSNSNTAWNSISVWGTHSTDSTVRANANNAVRALMNKGYSVTINGVLQTEDLLNMDAAASGN